MKRVFLDIEICYKCKKCTAKCSYFYHQCEILKIPTENIGFEKILAKAAQYIICRRCEQPFCIESCPNEALEKNSEGILQRSSMRCTSCKSCSAGCPFGTIYPDILPYKTSQCDFCFDRANGKLPLCVETCPEKALQYIEVEESKEKNIYFIGKNLAVHGIPWNIEAKVGEPK